MSFSQLPGWLLGLVACLVVMVLLATGWLLRASQTANGGVSDRQWWWATLLGVPLLAVLLYAKVGHPVAANPALGLMEMGTETMVDKLAARLKTDPADQSAWLMLARSHKVLGKSDEADQAYRHAESLGALPIDDLADWIQARIDLSGGAFDGHTRRLLAQAVAAAPAHEGVLLFQGLLAIDTGDYVQATRHLTALLSRYEAGSADHEALTQVVAQLKRGHDPRRKATVAPSLTPGN